MAFSITTRKELNKHVPFDISIVTDNLDDGEFFGEDKVLTRGSKLYIVTIPKAGQDKLKPYLRNIGVRGPFSTKTIELNIEESLTKYPNLKTLRLRKTGKTALAADAKTTAMQERASLEIIKQGLRRTNRKRYTNAKKVAKLPIYKKLVELYPDLNEGWLDILVAQHIKMNNEFGEVSFDTFVRDGGFMDWVSKYVRTNYGIAKKDTWNPADIWLLKNEKDIKATLKGAKSLEQFNDMLRTLYNDRVCCGISLKKVSGKTARFVEVNMKEAIPDSSKYSVENITQKWNLKPDGNLDVTDTLIWISTGNKSTAGKKSVKFQIRQNSKGFNNLKFEGTQVGAGAARLGKAPLDMLQALLKGYGITDFENDHNKYPKTVDEWEEEQDDYKKMYDAVHDKRNIGSYPIITNITKNKFVQNVHSSFLSGDNDEEFAYTTQRLMQLAFVSKLITLKQKDQNQLLTQMCYLAKKEGPVFGPHGKLY